MNQPLVSDAFVDFLLAEVLDVGGLCRLPYFSAHGPETLGPYLAACRRVAREVLWPAYRPMDAEPPRFVDGCVTVHPLMASAWKELVDLGVLSATRPSEVGGQQVPLTVATLASSYLMAANLSAYAYAGLTSGAAHLIEAFGDDEVKRLFLAAMYEGRWAGTMALTEPQAGSSLADVTTRATPRGDGGYSLRGAKIFISGGDQDVTENVVHLVLARIDGAPPGTKGISLFAVPKKRPGAGGLEPNDVQVSGVIHKIGWRGLPSVALSLGDEGDCVGWLVGPPHQGLKCMFQMMNEARLMVGVNAASTASVAFHEAVAWAHERKQGRPLGVADATVPPVPLVQHPDVRRMLLRQKAIVEGSLALLGITARYADLSEHATEDGERQKAKWVLDVLTPIAKTFPAERGFEANALAVQVHGGYGYSSEYPVEAWLRDQKLNSIHEGTTGIQGLDLLGRKAVAAGGQALAALHAEVTATLGRAREAGVDERLIRALADALETWALVTAELGARGAAGDVVGMLGHSHDYLELASTVVVAWAWLKVVAALGRRSDDFAQGLRAAARYWTATELPRVPVWAALCTNGEDSYLTLKPDWL
ncbi:MAG: acyl-CoA dehydrogenase [Myxococcota bacterium]